MGQCRAAIRRDGWLFQLLGWFVRVHETWLVMMMGSLFTAIPVRGRVNPYRSFGHASHDGTKYSSVLYGRCCARKPLCVRKYIKGASPTPPLAMACWFDLVMLVLYPLC